MEHRRARFAAFSAAFFCSIALTTTAISAEPPTVLIRYANNSTALQNCAEALRGSAALLGRTDLKINIDTSNEAKPSDALFIVQLAIDPTRDRAGMIFQVPFLFQNPSHFGRFLQSDLYRELMGADNLKTSERWIATAFGGSYNLFSRDHAMTERKHFYNRFVGGASHAAFYSKVGGAPALTTIVPDWKRDIDAMAAQDRMVEAVELPLIDALPFGLDRVAHVANLTFSLPLPVFFYLETSTALPPASIRRITRWAETAATACGAVNFEAERAALEKLKAGGMTVVPVKRPDFIEAGWSFGMTERYGHVMFGYFHAGWTIEDLDDVVKMGGDPKPRRLPSALLASLNSEQKKQFREKTKAAVAGRAQRKLAAATAEAVEAVVADGLIDITDAVRLADPRQAKLREFDSRDWRSTMHGSTPSTVRYRLEDIDEYITAKKLPQCDKDCVEFTDVYTAAAITLWQGGEQAGSKRILALLEQMALHYKHSKALLRVLRTRIFLNDVAAARGTAKALAALAIPDDATQVGHLVDLASMHRELGDPNASDRVLAQAAKLAGRKSTYRRSDTITVANAYVASGNITAAWELFTRVVEASTTPSEAEGAINSFVLRSEEVDRALSEVTDRISKLATLPKSEPARIRK